MTLVDTGPIVALLARRDPRHHLAVAAACSLSVGPMVTTWACMTEAMYLLGKFAGPAGQAELWSMVFAGDLLIRECEPQ